MQKLQEDLVKLITDAAFPTNPLDAVIDELGGPEHVAEMTGRKARLVRKGNAVHYENRNATGAKGVTLDLINIAEKQCATCFNVPGDPILPRWRSNPFRS